MLLSAPMKIFSRKILRGLWWNTNSVVEYFYTKYLTIPLMLRHLASCNIRTFLLVGKVCSTTAIFNKKCVSCLTNSFIQVPGAPKGLQHFIEWFDQSKRATFAVWTSLILRKNIKYAILKVPDLFEYVTTESDLLKKKFVLMSRIKIKKNRAIVNGHHIQYNM